MKKMLLSAAAFAVVAVSTAVVAPTTSEAIPAFARQTGAACLSCHFQSFPTISAFGRSFKMGGFTDVGEQALIEDDALSIPSVLNATVVVRPQIIQSKTGAVTTKEISYADQVVLIAGRIGSNTGAFVELGGGAFGNHQLIHSVDMGGFKVGASYYNTGFGEDAGMQLSNVWGQHGGMMNARFVSANQNLFKGSTIGGGQIAGLTAFIGNEMGAIQVGLTAPSDGTVWGVAGAGGSTFTAAPMVRANGFFEVGGMSLGLGGIIVNGNIGSVGQFVLADPLLTATQQLVTKRWGLDAQLEGELGDSQFGLYADYASAAKSTAVNVNNYNADTLKNLTGWSVRGTIKPLHNVVLAAGYGQAQATNKITYTNVAVEYEIYQNFIIALTHEISKATVAAVATTTKTTTLDIEALM
ncbi:MAG: hypothetical protein CO188_07445 [Zetaproteobacteria bacterium CG_4_9_14_3_um_filter_54_145]|nr:MAG: hypothetical protein COZ50_09235 [Zetaproteobacteria bacterium CG_4_10_14_3_um_filter_54_28]PJA29060.1 MAG: hypothetical protein CO188_07445 [Zetaproteobacteria bacterium CG_4_9_14_3_um_filter_54_145]